MGLREGDRGLSPGIHALPDEAKEVLARTGTAGHAACRRHRRILAGQHSCALDLHDILVPTTLARSRGAIFPLSSAQGKRLARAAGVTLAESHSENATARSYPRIP